MLNYAKAEVSDECVFSPDQIMALHEMLNVVYDDHNETPTTAPRRLGSLKQQIREKDKNIETMERALLKLSTIHDRSDVGLHVYVEDIARAGLIYSESAAPSSE